MVEEYIFFFSLARLVMQSSNLVVFDRHTRTRFQRSLSSFKWRPREAVIHLHLQPEDEKSSFHWNLEDIKTQDYDRQNR